MRFYAPDYLLPDKTTEKHTKQERGIELVIHSTNFQCHGLHQNLKNTKMPPIFYISRAKYSFLEEKEKVFSLMQALFQEENRRGNIIWPVYTANLKIHIPGWKKKKKKRARKKAKPKNWESKSKNKEWKINWNQENPSKDICWHFPYPFLKLKS